MGYFSTRVCKTFGTRWLEFKQFWLTKGKLRFSSEVRKLGLGALPPKQWCYKTSNVGKKLLLKGKKQIFDS